MGFGPFKIGLMEDKSNVADKGSMTLRVFLSGGGGEWYTCGKEGAPISSIF